MIEETERIMQFLSFFCDRYGFEGNYTQNDNGTLKFETTSISDMIKRKLPPPIKHIGAIIYDLSTVTTEIIIDELTKYYGYEDLEFDYKAYLISKRLNQRKDQC